MRLFPKELEIALDEGFTPEKDIFGRKAFGDRITSIITGIEAPLVLLLDAPWGTGKSTFVKMWAGELRKAGIPSIYFDAFSNDYQKDAFIAVSSYVIGEINKLTPDQPNLVKDFTDKAFKVAKVLGQAGFRIGVKAATAGLIEVEGFQKTAADVVAAAGDEANKAFDEALKARLEGHESDREAFVAFRESLRDLSVGLASSIATGTPQAGERRPAPRLIFIIDELDRCKPSFALSLIENIKHFFSVYGVYFVLVASLKQLESAVKYAYGDIEAMMYLEKFYNLRLQFPVGTNVTPDRRISTFATQLDCNGEIIDLLEQYDRTVRSISLRTLERFLLT